MKKLRVMLVSAGLMASLFFVNCYAMEKNNNFNINNNTIVKEDKNTDSTLEKENERLKEEINSLKDRCSSLKRRIKISENERSNLLKEKYKLENDFEKEVTRLNLNIEYLRNLNRNIKQENAIHKFEERLFGQLFSRFEDLYYNFSFNDPSYFKKLLDDSKKDEVLVLNSQDLKNILNENMRLKIENEFLKKQLYSEKSNEINMENIKK